MSLLIRWCYLLILCLYSSQVLAYWSCAWPYRTAVTVQETSASNLSNYQVKLTISGADLNGSYNWSDDGFDLRVVDSDDQTLMNYWVDDWDKTNKTATVWVRFDNLAASSSQDIYLYYGNEFADTLANVPFTFTEPGIKFHTRNISTNPNSLSEAFSLFNAGNDNNSNYGCAFITDFSGVENSILFGSNTNFIAYSETYFQVKAGEEGIWGIRYGSDFGGGGGLYVNGTALEEDWSNDLWWNNNWGHGDVLQGTINLSKGYHKLEVIGQEGGNDGGITVQFQKPSGSFTTYSTTNIDIVSRACPVNEPTVTFGAQTTATCPSAIASYRFDEGGWSGVGDVLDQKGSFPGTMVGNVSEEDPAKVCKGFDVADNNSGATIDAFVSGVNIVDDVGAQGSIAFWVNLKNNWNDGTRRKLMDASLLPTNSAAEKYFFIDKQTDGSIKFAFEDDVDFDVVLNEAGASSRTQDTWYHITVTFDFINGEFKVYEGETEIISATVATSGAIKDLNNIYFGDKNFNSSKGGSVNSANGRFDEINIYNTVISVSEIRGLLANFRDCTAPALPRACLGSFPNAVNSIKNRIINFGGNAQILSNPDNTLSAKTINKTSWSVLNTCDSSDCVTGDDEVKDVKPGNFQKTNASNDLTVNFAGSQTIGTSTDEFDVITVNSTGVLTFDSGVFSEFKIDKLDVGFDSTVNFEPGTYWIDDLNLSSEANLTVLNGGPVRLYVNKVIGWSSDVLINSPGTGLSGNAGELLMYFYSQVNMAFQTTFSGSLFVTQDVDLNQGGKYFGLITGENVTLGQNTQVTYDVNAYYGMSDISWCESGSAAVDSFIITAPATAVNCQAAEISIQVLDKKGAVIPDYEGVITLSASTGHGDWSAASTANGVLNNGSADDGLTTYGMLTGDLGVATFYLSNTHPENTTITVAAEGVTQTENINFQAAGFIFSSIATQTSGKQSSAISLQAVETDLVTGACAPLLLDTQAVEFAVECLSPTNCGSAVSQINSTSVSTNVQGSVLSYDDVLLDFGNSSDSDGGFTVSYDNAGSLRIWTRYQLLLAGGAASGNYISGSSSGFVVVPAGFCLEPSEANWQCTVPGLTVNCSAFKQAGDNFNLSVSAKVYEASGDYCSVASTTNFAGAVSLSHNLISPTAASGGDAGTLSVSNATLTNGTASIAMNISDMGVYTLTGGGNSYLGVSLPSTNSQNIGRFYPKEFFISSVTSAAYANANNTFQAPGTNGFTYVGQLTSAGLGAIHYSVPPSFNFQARGASGQKLKNYIGDFFRAPSASVSASSTIMGNTSLLSITSGFSVGNISGPDASDEYIYTFSNDDDFVYDRNANSLINVFQNGIQLNVAQFTDPIDGIGLASGAFSISGTGDYVGYGRLNIENAYGPETKALNQTWNMQYFNGTKFVLNPVDSDTGYIKTNIINLNVTDIGDTQATLLISDVTASNDASFNLGIHSVTWSAPINSHVGTINFTYNIESWLEYDWQGTGSNSDPQGNITFGLYRGHDKIIYWKEINY